MKSLKRHQLRVLLSSRKVILSKCVDLENELRGLLNIFGMRLASKVGHGAYDSTVRPLVEADPLLARGLLPLLEARLVLYKTYLKLDNEVQAVTRTDPICKRLMTVRGVGCYRRSRSRRRWMTQLGSRPSRTVAAHFGPPRRYQSGEIGNPGRISKAGDPDVRCALYMAAHALMTRTAAWSSLKVWGYDWLKPEATAER